MMFAEKHDRKRDRMKQKMKDQISPKDQLWIRYLLIALLVVVTHWMLMYVAYVAWDLAGDQSTSGFWMTIYHRFEEAGDIPHYVNIAKNWYHATGENANEIVFFPLYPLLMKFFYLFCRNYVVAGVLVSNVCLAVGSVYFYRLLEMEYGSECAWEGTILLTLFPVGFFMIGAYTESLFIMLTAACLYYIRQKRWSIAGITGMLAALSRSQGIVLLVPAVYEICLQFRKKENRTWTAGWVCLIPVGTLFYLLMNQVIYGKWNKFLEFQAAEPWYNTSQWISENLVQHYSMGIQYPYLGVIIYWAQIFLYFGAMLLLFYGLHKQVRTSYIALGGAYIFVTYLHGWMISGPRYMMSCLPLYLIVASQSSRIGKRMLLIAFGILTLFFHMWYIQGWAIM